LCGSGEVGVGLAGWVGMAGRVLTLPHVEDGKALAELEVCPGPHATERKQGLGGLRVDYRESACGPSADVGRRRRDWTTRACCAAPYPPVLLVEINVPSSGSTLMRQTVFPGGVTHPSRHLPHLQFLPIPTYALHTSLQFTTPTPPSEGGSGSGSSGSPLHPPPVGMSAAALSIDSRVRMCFGSTPVRWHAERHTPFSCRKMARRHSGETSSAERRDWKSDGPRASRGSVGSASQRGSGGMVTRVARARETDNVGDGGDGYDVRAARWPLHMRETSQPAARYPLR
jgi:hypothetical protein